ncbi:MAG: flavodoxin-dependent (E)-4-hydroxy-3-methylbut-2-enyl-diphosphate synthase [Firmicutes bacterium]|nr:flavodoxin-dependent (E)-4-hydroxy-3-methylbut-2-enyl-diphosphate synthase [Bacillota bacterium]
MTRRMSVGGVAIGGGAPITVQSMTNTDTRDVQATLAQIRALADAGCDLVRVSVYDEACAKAVRPLADASPVPLVADIHFDHTLAIRAVENGVHKLRVNPGNIGGEANVRRVADCARAHGVPIRVGVNSGSVERALLDKHGGPTPQAMADSALSHARLLEKHGFYDIVLSAKASGVHDTIAVNRLLASQCEYPLHIGVTEAGLPGQVGLPGQGGLPGQVGLPGQGTIKSAIGIGSLLADGIGDTIRVSLSGDPVPEVAAGLSILRALGLRGGVEIISCPTCGRAALDVAGIAQRIEAETRGWTERIKVAVMGCVVNGPGEAREADLGLAGGKSGAALFRRDKPPEKVTGDPCEALLAALDAARRERQETQ